MAGQQIRAAEPPERVRLATFVAGLAADVERALQPQACPFPITGLQQGFAERQFALGFDLLVLDLAGDQQALFEVQARLRVVAEIGCDLPQVQESDGLADAVSELAKELQRFKLARSRTGRIAALQTGR